MHEVTARARSGYLLALDQCGSCGGIWFDRWELFPLDNREVARLDGLDAGKLMSARPARDGPGTCPRCAIALRPFHDPVLPPDARIARCAVCEGMWLQRGELARVKPPARAPLAPAAAIPASDQAVVALAEHYARDADWSKVADLDGATYSVEEAPPSAGDLGVALRAAAPWVVLQLLMRLFLRR